MATTSNLTTAKHLYTVQLAPLTLRVSDYRISGSYQVQEQLAVDGTPLCTNAGMRAHRLLLKGACGLDELPDMVRMLEEYLSNNTTINFYFLGLHFVDMKIVRYVLSETADAPSGSYEVELLGTALTEETI